MFRKMPFILLFLITLILLLHPFISLYLKQLLFATSLTIKSFIIFLLPTIFGLLFNTMINMANQASKIIFLILFCVCCSNILSTFLSHYIGKIAYHIDLSLILYRSNKELLPLWSLPLPTLI